MTELDWWTIAQAGKALNRCGETVHGYIRKGWLQASQIAPRANVLVSRRSVEQLLARRMNRPAR